MRNLVERRSLLFQLVRRDLSSICVGSAMGSYRGLIHPLVLLASWVFIFQVCLHETVPEGEVTHNYPLFLFAGMLPWMLFTETLTRSATSLLEQANLITKTVCGPGSGARSADCSVCRGAGMTRGGRRP